MIIRVSSMNKKQTGILLFILLACASAASFFFFFAQRLDIIWQNPNPLIRHFSPTWRSIKKLSDLRYLPQAFFHESTLPVYELILSRNDAEALIAELPELRGGTPFLTDEYKQFVKANFRTGSFQTQARVRYRGLLPNHWSALKKSWQINLPPEEPLNGRTDIRLIIPEDRQWTAQLLETPIGHPAMPRGKRAALIPDLLRRQISPIAPESISEIAQDLNIVTRTGRRIERLPNTLNTALTARYCPFGFAPRSGGRKDDMGHLGCLR